MKRVKSEILFSSFRDCQTSCVNCARSPRTVTEGRLALKGGKRIAVSHVGVNEVALPAFGCVYSKKKR